MVPSMVHKLWMEPVFGNLSAKLSFSPVSLSDRQMNYPKMPSWAYRAHFYHFHDDLHGQ